MTDSPENVSRKLSMNSLPDELLVDVFEFLSLRDQTLLGTCCKRFRSINRAKVRRKFDAIVVFWGDSFQYVNTYESYRALKKAKCFSHAPGDEGLFEIDESNEHFFENAKTNVLEITIKQTDDRPFRFFSRLFNTLQYSSLEIDFTVSERSNLALLQTLMIGRDLSKSELIIKWSRAINEDIENTRKFLLEFPAVRRLELTWIYWGTNAESLETEVLTEDILLHLVDQCKEELIVDCSVAGLLDVYEKLVTAGCRTWKVTVRSTVASEFCQVVEEMGRRDVTVVEGKKMMHDGGIPMRQIVMTKESELFEDCY